MYAKLNSIGLLGVGAYTIEVECDTSAGLPAFDIVGLPDASVRESRNRVRSSIKNCGYEFPVSRITVNLAPANTPKEGSSLDLPILIALLKATGQLQCQLDGCIFIGELSLSGDIRQVRGIIAMAVHAMRAGYKKFYMPCANAAEASVLDGIDIYPVENITQLIDHLHGVKLLPPASQYDFPRPLPPDLPDFSDVRGQYNAKFAIEVAAAGGHNLLFVGPPGSGKSMLAKRLPSILPPLTFQQSLDTTVIHSICGTLPPNTPLVRYRPFRSPHHTISAAGLTGGGSTPKPGEISLAHNGVLFLDELPEFSRLAIESLRQPIEDSVITITRVNGSLTFPCSVMLVAAMNPCPCGFFGDSAKQCVCPKPVVQKYLQQLSGPMLDRLDIHVEVPTVKYSTMEERAKEEPSAKIKERVLIAHKIQEERYKGEPYAFNAKVPSKILYEHCNLTPDADRLLSDHFHRESTSARGQEKLLRLCRTVADLKGSKQILPEHLTNMLTLRAISKKYWG